jgi:hypothetical protein
VTFPSTRHDTHHDMHHSARRSIGPARRTAIAGATAATAASLLVTAPAVADEPAPSRMTAIPSAFQVDPGERFVVRGRMLSKGVPVVGAPVRVRTWSNGRFVDIEGARVTTNSEGRYRVRIVLYRKGDRLLKVAANPAGDDIRTARRNVLMQVGPMPKNP